ncbi:N-acetyltransferase GCN5 [Betaproteobacteria bacterium]|nr:N-acetyltransferase GCN5 [Betaproteobacteria bacterium]GHU07640.1 N-acetyltransferase GCN5 [Betaproteobacteria bacterium]GHU22874.1 N-acetyltransferase GCN5 [Betaproteobacteria bacterium]
MTDTFRSERLNLARHDVAGFSCGQPELDTWLRQHAATAHKRGTARTWVWLDAENVVAGYYALAAHKISRADIPTAIGRGGPVEIPAVLLAKLALARHLHGQGLGAVLVADALERIVAATQTVAARLVVVDAITEDAARFYQTVGFRRIPDSLRLVQKIADIEAALTPTKLDA